MRPEPGGTYDNFFRKRWLAKVAKEAVSPDSDVMLWTEDFDPWSGQPATPAGVTGVALEPVELRIARGDVRLARAGVSPQRALEDIAFAGLRTTRARLGHNVEVELPAPPSITRSRAAIVAFAEAAGRVDDQVTICLPCTRAGTDAVEELTARGVKTSIEIWSHEDLFPATQSFIVGLERRAARRRDLHGITSVAWLRLQPLRAASAERLRASPLADSVASAAAQACYLTATRLFTGSRWHQLRHLGASPLRPGFRMLDDAADADALALPGTALAVAASTGAPTAEAEADETTIAWTLEQAGREGVDLAALGSAIRERRLQRRAFLERAALTRLAEVLRARALGEDASDVCEVS
jgi:hypothetical protein